MAQQVTCGEATIKLLEKYNVDTIFGIPGVHTLDFYRGLDQSPIKHVQTRHEQGAAFMADGYARASGRPGVCLLISGPGVINGLTAIGQSWADSVPVLMLSSTTASYTHGKGWGVLHEVPDLQAVTDPLTALSAVAYSPADVPELIGQAFSIFASQRPRPVHIAIPTDVLEMMVDPDSYTTVRMPTRPTPNPDAIAEAASLLVQAERPLIMVGGGAKEAAGTLTEIAETLNASVVSSAAGKGIVPESHPLSLGGGIWRQPVLDHIGEADVILAIGTELSETDSFIEKHEFAADSKLIRIDIDPSKINDLYPAEVGIVSDAAPAAESLLVSLKLLEATGVKRDTAGIVQAILKQVMAETTGNEKQHAKALDALREMLPSNALITGDMTQIMYSGMFAFSVDAPGLFHYPAGFCTLGCGLPNGIGAKLALPKRPVVVLAGDGGFMFTVNDLITAAELGLNLPIIIWENGGLMQIKDDMDMRDIVPVGVQGVNPDFMLLAQSMGCHATKPNSMADFTQAVADALNADRPTVIELTQGADWLK